MLALDLTSFFKISEGVDAEVDAGVDAGISGVDVFITEIINFTLCGS